MIPRERAQRTLVALFVLLGGGSLAWWLLNAYSVRSPYGDFTGAAVEFLEAGLAMDSAKLSLLGASPAAARWVLEAGRRDPTLLRDLIPGLRILSGQRNDEMTSVLFRPTTRGKCYNLLVAVTFTGKPAAARVHEITATCVQAQE